MTNPFSKPTADASPIIGHGKMQFAKKQPSSRSFAAGGLAVKKSLLPLVLGQLASRAKMKFRGP
ncbi:MAG: hypothetical protein ABI162_02090 [Luteolibacter sp.]